MEIENSFDMNEINLFLEKVTPTMDNLEITIELVLSLS